MNIFSLFKKAKTEPLPEYPTLPMAALPAASTILYYGGNKLTEIVGNKMYKHPYRPPAFHAALYIGRVPYLGENLTLNVGKFRTLEPLQKELRSTRRVDAIVYNIPNEAREAIKASAVKDTSAPSSIVLTDYAFTDYLRFGFKFLKPSKKDFCSENVVEHFTEQGIKVSDLKAVDTAPWDLLEFGIAHPDLCSIYTLHVGPDFKR